MPRENEHCINKRRISTQSSPLPRSLLFFPTMRWIPFCPEWADQLHRSCKRAVNKKRSEYATMHSWAPIPLLPARAGGSRRPAVLPHHPPPPLCPPAAPMRPHSSYCPLPCGPAFHRQPQRRPRPFFFLLLKMKMSVLIHSSI